MVHYFLALVLLSAIVESKSATPYTVTGLVRNEFSYDLTLQSSAVSQGSFISPPAQTIVASPQGTYVPVFTASGDDGVVGSLTYVVKNAPNPSNPPRATFYFMNIAGNQTYTTKACCSPFIGGVGTKSGDAYSVQYQFWTHQMCLSSSCEKKY